jgi:HAE1 family hydrophobic/amphiphilic exporter-1
VVQQKIQTALDQHLLVSEGVTVSQGGDMQQMAEYGPTLVIIFLLALVLVFAVMAAQFESLVDPFIIFATIPLLLIVSSSSISLLPRRSPSLGGRIVA